MVTLREKRRQPNGSENTVSDRYASRPRGSVAGLKHGSAMPRTTDYGQNVERQHHEIDGKRERQEGDEHNRLCDAGAETLSLFLLFVRPRTRWVRWAWKLPNELPIEV